MSTQLPEEPRITIEDLRRKADKIKLVAQAEAKEAMEEEVSKWVVVAAVAIGVAVSFAYFMGSRRCRL